MTQHSSVLETYANAGQTRIQHTTRGTAGSALVAAAMFCAIASLLLVSILTWAANHGRLVRRQQEYLMAQYVAEAGTEKVISAIRSNLYSTGVAPSQTTLNLYATNQLPSSADGGVFTNYHFVSVAGVTNALTLSTSGTSTIQAISSGTYTGLNALITSYSITARANSFNRPVKLTTGVQRVMQIQSIPIFQFAVFYQGNLEVMPGADMTINGGLHSNGSAYIFPEGASLTIDGNTTAVGGINENPEASLVYSGGPNNGPIGPLTFNGSVTPDAGSLNLPIQGTTPYAILQQPPGSGNDPISAERLYTEAGLRIIVSSAGTVTATSGSGSSVTLNSSVISTTNTLYDNREGQTIYLTQINVGNLISHSEVPANGIIYVNDQRTVGETAVRLANAGTLPAGGLTVATPKPVYVWGNYNTADVPAAILCDAIDILSGSWSDSNSSKGIGNRVATSTTVNSAFYTGNVPTSGESYSGGLENLPRFLEDWSSATFTYKGSMVCMFASQYATGPWANASYNPPTRVWSFDTQFLYSSTLPPGTPAVQTFTRTAWAATQ